MNKIVVFTQSGCGPCRQLKPFLATYADESGLPIEEWDVTENWPLCQEYFVSKTPTVFIMDADNNELKRVNWSNPLQMLKELRA